MKAETQLGVTNYQVQVKTYIFREKKNVSVAKCRIKINQFIVFFLMYLRLILYSIIDMLFTSRKDY